MSNVSKIPLFLFGNGLSMALSEEFSLKKITNKFVQGLDGDEKKFLEELCGGVDNLNFDDFEVNFSLIDEAYSSLVKYQRFIESNAGKILLEKFRLPNPNLNQHEAIIKSIYDKYIFEILNLIQGNVTLYGIEACLKEFSTFLANQLSNSPRGYVFTLNFDLLAETILLQNIGTNQITDFCASAYKLKGSSISKFDFDPAMNDDRHGDAKIELHHLHGSLSLFYDYTRNKAIKIKSEDIFQNGLYQKIQEDEFPLHPAIITGGGKSSKITEYPFEFYHRSLKDYCTYVKFGKLFIVGYSFRDEHINELIKRWIKNSEDYTKGLLIVDYKTEINEQEAFKDFVSKALKNRKIPDNCFEFNGANSIRDVEGTILKRKK